MKQGLFKGINRRKKRAQSRKDSITQAAIQVLKEKGYEQATMQDIAAAADLSTSSVYYYFDGKDAILEEAFTLLENEIAAASQEILNSAQPQKDAVQLFLQRLAFFQDFNLIGLLAEVQHNRDLEPHLQKMIQTTQIELRQRMASLAERTKIQSVQPALAADMVLSIGLGALILNHLQKTLTTDNIDIEKVVEQFNSLLFEQSQKTEQENS
jgi:AcrR family transcriptional regulator